MENRKEIHYITLPPMRVAYHVAVGESPEDDAMKPVIDWLKSENLLSTARLFGGNMPPMPSEPGAPYGYGMCATIPESTVVPSHLKEVVMPGGLYAATESGDDIGASWKALMKEIARAGQYKADRSRLCYEEHIRNDRPEGAGNEYYVTLLEPVK